MPVARISGYVEERWSRAAWWSRRVAVFAVFVAAVSIAAHRFGADRNHRLSFGCSAWCCAGHLRAAAWPRRDSSASGILAIAAAADLTIGSVLGALLLAPYAVAGWWAFSHPALADISTDLDDPPRLAAAAAFRTADMNPIIAPTAEKRVEQTKAYPEMTGRRYAVSFEQMASAVEMLMRASGLADFVAAGRPQHRDDDRSVAGLPVLALPYDMAVRITDEGNAIYVDMRSASRYGSRDLGMNATRITDFLTELDTQRQRPGRASAARSRSQASR